MRNLTEETLTEAVLARLARAENPRFKEIMTSVIRHLHAAVREVGLTEAEWAEVPVVLVDPVECAVAPWVDPTLIQGILPMECDPISAVNCLADSDHNLVADFQALIPKATSNS